MIKQIIKKLTAAAAALICCAGCMTGCREEKPLTIVTTMYTTYDFVKQLTAEYEEPVEVKMLLTPGGESHSYEPSPADAAAVQSCDLFVYIGGVSESWAQKLVDSSRQNKISIRMFDCVKLLNEETVEGMQAGEEPESETEIDEHVWTAPLNADAMLTAIRDSINAVAPEEREHCNAAYDRVHADLLELDARAREISENAENDTLIFADRFPFRYLTNAYGWKYYAAFAGCSSDTDVSAATLSFLINKTKDLNADTVFYLENSSEKIADAVSSATGAQAMMLQSCNNVSRVDFDAGMHYQALMRENLDAIEEALN